MPEVTVLLFGKAAELAAARQVTLHLPDMLTYAQLHARVFENVEAIRPISTSCLLAVNQRYVNDPNEEISVESSTEISVIPPISGG